MFEIKYASIQDIHNAYREKQATVREIVMYFLSEIAKIDKCKDGLNSVLEINPDVLFIADELDKRLKDGEELTPLFGIPILLKDNINTADRLHTSAGSLDIMLCETFTNIAPFTGFPSMTIPIGQRADKLPMDSYWIARRFDEATLLKVTYAAEQLLGIHLTPELGE